MSLTQNFVQPTPDDLAQQFVSFAVEAGVLRFGDFKTKAGRMSPIGLYGRGDLRQELIAEVMYVARHLPLKRPNFVTRRLMLAAAKRLARRLEREWYQRLDEWYGRLDHVSAVTTEEGSAEGEE